MADSFGLKIGVDGEKDFKRALADINKSFKVLGSEMKLVTSQFDKEDKSVQALTARNEVLNKQIDAQKEKIATLKTALNNAAESFGENDRRTKEWRIQLNNAEAALNGMERELQQNNSEIEKSSSDFDDAKKSVDKFGDEIKESGDKASGAKDAFSKAGKAIKSVTKVLTAAIASIGAASVATGKKLWDLANDSAEAGDEIDKQSQKLGLSAENYQKLTYAMERNGADIEDFKRGVININKNLAAVRNNVVGAGKSFDKLGVSLKNSDGSMRSTEDVLLDTIDALSSMEDETQRNLIANEIFGKNYTELAPLLNSGSEGIRELMGEAEEYGMVMSDDAVKASAAFEDSLTKMKGTISGVKNSMMSDFLPGLTLITDGFTDLVAGDTKGTESIKKGIKDIIAQIKKALPQFVSLLGAIGSALLESAPEILSELLTSILDILPTLLEEGTPVLLDALEVFLTSVIDSLPTILETLFTTVLPNLAQSAVNLILTLITTLANSLPQILPSLVQGLMDVLTTLFSAENIEKFIVALISAIKGIIAGLTQALPILIQGVTTLITELVRALPQIIQLIVAEIPNLVEMIFGKDGLLGEENIGVIIQSAIDIIMAIVDSLPDIIMALIDAIPTIISAIFDTENGFLSTKNLSKLFNGLVQIIKKIVIMLPKVTVKIIRKIPEFIKKLVKAFKNKISNFVTIGKNLVQGLWNGIKGAAAWIWEKISGWLGGLWKNIKGYFGISSPSKKMRDEIGKNLVRGLAQGIEDEGSLAVDAMTNMAKDVASVSFAPAMVDFQKINDDFAAAIPANIGTSMRASVIADSENKNPVSNTFNNSFSFGNVTINNDSDVENIAHRVSNIIVSDIMAKGGAYA